MDLILQSRPPAHGLGWIDPEPALGQGCITLLLLTSVENGGITHWHQRN
jgi:hypothetical protein